MNCRLALFLQFLVDMNEIELSRRSCFLLLLFTRYSVHRTTATFFYDWSRKRAVCSPYRFHDSRNFLGDLINFFYPFLMKKISVVRLWNKWNCERCIPEFTAAQLAKTRISNAIRSFDLFSRAGKPVRVWVIHVSSIILTNVCRL